MQEVDGFRRLRAGGAGRFIVRAQHGSPIRDILGMLQSSALVETLVRRCASAAVGGNGHASRPPSTYVADSLVDLRESLRAYHREEIGQGL